MTVFNVPLKPNSDEKHGRKRRLLNQKVFVSVNFCRLSYKQERRKSLLLRTHREQKSNFKGTVANRRCHLLMEYHLKLR